MPPWACRAVRGSCNETLFDVQKSLLWCATLSTALHHPAASCVLGLVCGYPAPKQWRQIIVALKAYIDDSRKNGTLVIGGYVANAVDWARFSIEWKKRLDEVGIAEFRMSERINSPNEINGYFYRAIEEHVLASVCVVMPEEPLSKVVAEFELPSILQNPYHLGVKAIVDGCLQHQQLIGISDPIDFVFDEQTDVRRHVERAWDLFLETLSEEELGTIGARPIWGKSHLMMPLQAADIFVYWHRKRINEGGDVNDPYLPFPWKPKRNIRRLMIWFDEDLLRKNLLRIRKMYERAQRGYDIDVTYSFEGKPLVIGNK